MELKTISYSHGLTINTGNFQSVRIDVGATAQLIEGDNVHDCFSNLVVTVMELLEYERAKVG